MKTYVPNGTIKDEVPILFAPGWSNTQFGLRQTLEILSEVTRRKVVSLSHSRKVANIKSQAEYPKEEVQKAQALLDVIEKLGCEKVDGIGYSEGAFNLLIAATLSPDKFRNIVLLEPSGMVGRETVGNIMKNLCMEGITILPSVIRSPRQIISATKVVIDLLVYCAKNPALAFREVNAVCRADLSLLIKALHGKGKKVFVVHGINDKVIPFQKVIKHIDKDGLKNFMKLYCVAGGHVDIILQPERCIGIISKIL